MSGYVRIHRALCGHTAFRNDAEAMAFAWLVMKAAWQPTKVRYKDRIIFLDRGQAAMSVRDFAKAMDRDKAWIERLFKRLKAEAMLTTRHETGVNVVTICNYNEYQSDTHRRETPSETQDETSARQGRDTEQVREEREEDNSEAIASGATRQPLSEALSFWNANAAHAGWRLAKGLTAERPKHLRARLRENGIDGFRAAITRARASPYLAGADPPPWFTFDWIIKAANFQKLIEGNYDRRHADSADPTLVALSTFGTASPGG
jgi:DNA-binding transcriptional regulator YhcF (GntR family)